MTCIIGSSLNEKMTTFIVNHGEPHEVRLENNYIASITWTARGKRSSRFFVCSSNRFYSDPAVFCHGREVVRRAADHIGFDISCTVLRTLEFVNDIDIDLHLNSQENEETLVD
jgi:hypothetical protein